ncbi:MAG: DUF721 domain-containing protein [Bacillota bacterium]
MNDTRAAHTERLDRALEALIRRMGLEARLARQRVLSEWDRVVGPEIAARARPVRLSGSELVVAVEHAGWAQQLAFFKAGIIKDLNRAVGSELVRDIRFVHGRSPGRAAGNRPEPAGAAGPGPDRAGPVSGGGVAPAGEAPAQVVASLGKLRDAEVRTAARRWLVAAWQRRQRARLQGWPVCTRCGCPFRPAGQHAAPEERVCPACRAAEEERLRRRVRALLRREPWLAYPEVERALVGTAPAGALARLYREERAALLAEWRSQLRACALRLRAGESPPPGARQQLLAYVMLRAGLPPDRLEPGTVRETLGPGLQILYDHFFGQPRRDA